MNVKPRSIRSLPRLRAVLSVIRHAAGDLWNEELHDAWAEGFDAITSVMMNAHNRPQPALKK